MKQQTEDIIFYISIIPITIVAFVFMAAAATISAVTIWNVVGWLKQMLYFYNI